MEHLMRRIMRRLPITGPKLAQLDTFTRDHLALVAAHTHLESAYLALRDEYHQLVQEQQSLLAAMQRLTRPPFSTSPGVDEPAEIAGIPIPPPILRYWVAGSDDLHWFLNAGLAGAESLEHALAQYARPLHGFESILDFGCGCGRLLRHLPGRTPARLHGCDLNAAAITWCSQNLRFATFEVNSLHPPLPYADHSFDLITALSVFTHLRADLQQPWFDELRRLTRPGGYLAISVHGESYVEMLTVAEQEWYRRGELVVHEQDQAGENSCSAVHPYEYVVTILAAGCRVAAFLPQGATGNPHQDLYLLQVL